MKKRGGLYLPHTDVTRDPRRCDMARKATWKRHADPRQRPAWCEGGVDVWQGHTSPRERPGEAMWQCERLACDGPMG